MRGTIFHQNESKKWYSVQFPNGDYTVIELRGNGSVQFGDIISGEMHQTGFTTLTNETSLTTLEVQVIFAHLNRIEALQHTNLL